ncbi:DUF6387 family protein [Shewanella oneidensis]|uniref:Uncharacterized protein n=1 Tax=Shewanella oneidensis (strain ATCC 700550 / JCM 31522 / CIP 106686 / LMG 19005 / NCIMB 14063 / MR-1) TaxID=211586 RepID=Q8EJS5_SHEON|nr:DUF6387 family protein [Shewanella oneidensis]AAN53470.1 uncharacterized protein SO_0387 [Shewanella oneidensis MR-1]MDX5997663.1 DUF6387 family protein [Shewanella oneidensis]MEE2027623.1 hypothetical protein [Shewanella oneidensis]
MKTSTANSIRIKTSDHPKWPNWFSIKNYDCLADLTAAQFLNELEFRLTLHNSPTLPNGRKLTDSKRWQLIQNGYVIINSNPVTQPDFPTVIALNHVDLLGITEEIKLRSGDDYLDLEPQQLMPLQGQSRDLTVVGIDLTKPNKAILGDCEFLINQLRKTLSIPEPKVPDNFQANEKTFKKLLTYKLIPYLDLMMYCYNHIPFYEDNWQKLEFTQNVLSELLLGEESKQELRMELYKKTYAPFYRKILSNESHLMQLLANIRQNTWALGTKMQDI